MKIIYKVDAGTMRFNEKTKEVVPLPDHGQI